MRFLLRWGRTLAVSAFILLGSSGIPAYVSDNAVYTPPNYTTFQPPILGGSYNDPVFGTAIKRISSAPTTISADSGANLVFIVHEYSSMTPFSSDNSRLLAIHQSYYALYDGAGNFVRNLPIEINASSEPRWSRADANTLYYLRGNQLKKYDIAANTITTVRAFSEYSAVSGRGESDICFDGNHFVLVGDHRYVFVYDIATGIKSPVFDTAGQGFDSVYITPNDNVTITWLQSGSARYQGIELFDRNMNFVRQVTRAGGHMDVSRDTDGQEVLIWTNSADPQPICDNGIVKVRLSDAQQTCLLSLDWTLAVHISAPDSSGYAFVSTYAPADPTPSSGWRAYTNELLQVRLDGAETRRLAHHRSRPHNGYNYMPKASVSRDGTQLAFSSNYTLQSILGWPSEYSDIYLVGVTGGTTPPPPPPPPPPPSTSTRVEESNAAIVYSGAWYPNVNGMHSGGSAIQAMDAGARATLTFTGTGATWIAYRDEWAGIGRVYLDGVLRGTFDTYATPHQPQATQYSVTGLASGQHTLVVEATGTRNAASGGAWVWVDGFDVISGSGGTPPPTVVRFEQNNAAAVYGGTWSTNTAPALSGGTAALSMARGSRVTFTFTGTAVSWIGNRDQSSGIARVYLDGALVDTVDTYSSSPLANTSLFSRSGLAAGTHTLMIYVEGRKNRRSGGRWVWVDAFDVTQ